MTVMKGSRGRMYKEMWDSNNIWVGNGNLQPEFAQDLVRMLDDPKKTEKMFVTQSAKDRPTFRFRVGKDREGVKIYQETSMKERHLDEHTVVIYNGKGEKLDDSQRLWAFQGKTTPGNSIEQNL